MKSTHEGTHALVREASDYPRVCSSDLLRAVLLLGVVWNPRWRKPEKEPRGFFSRVATGRLRSETALSNKVSFEKGIVCTYEWPVLEAMKCFKRLTKK